MDPKTKEWLIFFKSHFWLFIIFTGFFLSGMFLQAKLCQNQCNQHIVENFYPELLEDPFAFDTAYDCQKNLNDNLSELQQIGSCPYKLLSDK